MTDRDSEARLFDRKPILRRVVYVFFFEVIAIFLTIVILDGVLGHSGTSSTIVAVAVSAIAVTWNFIWNTIFEHFEVRFKIKGRNFFMRFLHAIGFEIGLLVWSLPVIALILQIPVLEAFLTQIGLLIFFFFYTYIFAWVFDKIFGLPASAQ